MNQAPNYKEGSSEVDTSSQNFSGENPEGQGNLYPETPRPEITESVEGRVEVATTDNTQEKPGIEVAVESVDQKKDASDSGAGALEESIDEPDKPSEIEKEFVVAADQIIEKNKDKPFELEEAQEDLKIGFLKRIFNRILPKSKD